MSHLKPRILVVSTSLAPQSRSRTMARAALTVLARTGAIEHRWIDLAEHDLQPFPLSRQTPIAIWIREEFESADGFILACPVYNWSAGASLPNFLHYVLDSRTQRRYRPFVVMGGAGSPRSALALDGVARSMLYEIRGIQIGPTVIGAGADVDAETGLVAPALSDLMREVTEILIQHAAIATGRVEAQDVGLGA